MTKRGHVLLDLLQLAFLANECLLLIGNFVRHSQLALILIIGIEALLGEGPQLHLLDLSKRLAERSSHVLMEGCKVSLILLSVLELQNLPDLVLDFGGGPLGLGDESIRN